MTNIQKLAKQVYKALETKERPNGETYIKFEDGSPEWMKELARHAHGDMMPDDYRYRFLEEACELISSYDDAQDARDSLEADIYTNNLTAWLHSRNDRASYVDDAINEFGKGENLTNDLMAGQLLEKQETFDLVLGYLETNEADLIGDTEENALL